MEARDVLKSQYLAALAMLRDAVVKCPDAMWNDPADKNRYWHIAFHAIFYTHLYAQPRGEDFVPWSKHRDEYEFMGPLPWPPHREPNIGEPYTKAEVLEYLDWCKDDVVKNLETVDLSAPSGFDWLPFGKLELQIYSIRHIMQHAGELCERLGTREGIDINWVGMVSDN